MDAVKSPSAMPVQAAAAPKRPQPPTEGESAAKPDNNAANKSAYDQPKPTTNSNGEKLGQRLNAVA